VAFGRDADRSTELPRGRKLTEDHALLVILKWWGGGLLIIYVIISSGQVNAVTGGITLLILLVGFFAPVIELYLKERRDQTRRLEAQRLLDMDDVDEMSGVQFEDYVAILMENMGYEVKLVRGGSDFGADLIAIKNGTRIAVQTKRYSRPVPRAAVSDAIGGRQYFNCAKAIVVTNHVFSKSALELAESTDCLLVDYMKLSEWIRNFQAGRQERKVQK